MKQHLKNTYIHTMDGQPAYYDGDQIIYAHDGVKLEDFLVSTLPKIKRELAASRRYRRAKGWPDLKDYGYLRLRI